MMPVQPLQASRAYTSREPLMPGMNAVQGHTRRGVSVLSQAALPFAPVSPIWNTLPSAVSATVKEVPAAACRIGTPASSPSTLEHMNSGIGCIALRHGG